MTGRHEVALHPRDYNFFSPRPKPRKPTQQKGPHPPQEEQPPLPSQQHGEHGLKQQAMGPRDAQGAQQHHQDVGEGRQHQVLPMPPELQNSLHHHMVRSLSGASAWSFWCRRSVKKVQMLHQWRCSTLVAQFLVSALVLHIGGLEETKHSLSDLLIWPCRA